MILRKANAEDIDRIMNFIKANWLESHILANEREFFEYQHCYGREITFCLAEEGGEIYGILGYIPYGQIHRDIMTVLWKTVGHRDPFLGVKLLQFLISNTNARIVASCGINRETIGIYKYMGFYTGKLKHYYRIADRTEYKIAKLTEKIILPIHDYESSSLVNLETFEDFKLCCHQLKYNKDISKPFKELSYIKKRYYDHPVYRYHILGIQNCQQTITSVLIGREIRCNGEKIFRMIDFLGDVEDLRYISKEVQRLITENQYEYIDCYQDGISAEIMNCAGFVENDGHTNVIPNYFEPFVQKNIDLYYFTTAPEGFVIFKGDGDQDRPNYYI